MKKFKQYGYNMANMGDNNSDLSSRNKTLNWSRDVFRCCFRNDYK